MRLTVGLRGRSDRLSCNTCNDHRTQEGPLAGEVGHAFDGKIAAGEAFLHAIDVHAPLADCLIQPFLSSSGSPLVDHKSDRLRKAPADRQRLDSSRTAPR